jgi:hypothetical protein
MTVKEKAHNHLWSRIQHTERELVELQSEMCSRSQNRISLSNLEKMYESRENKLSMYNYLFKLVELDEE